MFVFAVVALVVRSKEGGPPPNDPPVISYLAIGFAVMTFVMRAVMLPAITKTGRKPYLAAPFVTTKELMGLLTNRMIIGAALLGLVGTRRRSTFSAARSFSTRRSSASSLFRS